MIHKTLPIFLAISVLTGCAMNPNSTARLVNKNEVSVESALVDVGKGIGGMKLALDGQGAKTGIYVDSIDLDLVLSATQNENQKLTLGLNPIDLTSLSKISGNLSAEEYKAIVDSRGSTLKIRFKSANSYNLELQKMIFDAKAAENKATGTTTQQSSVNGQQTNSNQTSSGKTTSSSKQGVSKTNKEQDLVIPVMEQSDRISQYSGIDGKVQS